MKRLMFYALTCLATVLFSDARASEDAVTEKVVAREQCEKAKVKCAKGKDKQKKRAAKKKTKPFGKVAPRIPKDYAPPALASPRTRGIIVAYKSCMYDGDENRLSRALERNLRYRFDASIFGSPEKLANEVCLSDALGLKRYETLAEIEAANAQGELVEIPILPHLEIADDLPDARRYARPWVRDYLVALARDVEQFVEKEGRAWRGTSAMIRVGSLVRSYADQRRQTNSPASCQSEICSTHTTGAAVDISNNRFSLLKKEQRWLRERLLADRKMGKIIMIEEAHPPHFHLFVLPPEFVPTNDGPVLPATKE